MDKEQLDKLFKEPGFRKMKELMNASLPGAVWWYMPKLRLSGSALKQAEEVSGYFWGEGRSRQGRWAKLVSFVQKYFKSAPSFMAKSPVFFGVWGFSLTGGNQNFGYLVLTGVPEGPSEFYPLLERLVQLTTESYWKSEEINRLSATIRPRAIALSTVHTVHRIINSTLNLDELVSRLAHLTAQVLRVTRCSIYLMDRNSSKKALPLPAGSPKPKLICKALVGYPATDKRGRAIPLGSQLEGRVAKSADIQLRKKCLCIPLIDEDVIGVVTVTGKKDKSDFNAFDLEILTTLAEEAVIAIKNAQLYEDQRRVALNTIQSLAVILGSRMPQNSVLTPEAFAHLALRTAENLQLSDEQMQALHYAALLKETTKLGIPEEILKKTEKLTREEVHKLRSHPIHGAQLVQNFESLKNVAPIILYSREKFDGSGYPEGLKGESIPIGARILAVLNAFEAIVVGRPYRGKSSQESALGELERNVGTQFDPRVVEAFLRVIRKESLYKHWKHASGT